MKIKDNAPVFETGDFWYDMFQGGYLKFENYLEEPELTEILKAVQLIGNFEDSLRENDLIYDL